MPDRVSFFNPDGSTFEVHSVPIGTDPHVYAHDVVERERKQGNVPRDFVILGRDQQEGEVQRTAKAGRPMPDEIPPSGELTIVSEVVDAGGHKLWTANVSDAPLKALDTALTKEYAENLILQQDMHTSLETMKLWHEKYASATDPEARIIGKSLFRDAIVQFVGCFDKTAQYPLSAEAIYGHDPDGMSSFQWFKDVRDAYAGHKFGAWRQCVVGVIERDGQRGVGHILAAFRGQQKEDGDQLRGFMQTAAAYLDANVERLRKAVMTSVESLKPNEIAALNEATARTLKMPEARFTRADLNREKPAPKR